MGKEDKIQ